MLMMVKRETVNNIFLYGGTFSILVSLFVYLLMLDSTGQQAPSVLEPSFFATFKRSTYNSNSSLHTFTYLPDCSNKTHVFVEIPLRQIVKNNTGSTDRIHPSSEEYYKLTIQTSIDEIIQNFQTLYPVEEMKLRPEFIDIHIKNKYRDADSYANKYKTFANLVSNYGCVWKERNFKVQMKHEVEKVILFGIDGMGSHNMAAAKMPTLDDIRKHGKYSLSTWLDGFSMGTSSGPNWSGILTGRNSDITGVKGNECTQPRVMTIMQKLILAGKKSAVMAEWENFECYFNDSSYHMPYKWTGASSPSEFNSPNAAPYTYINVTLMMEKVHADYDFIFIYAGSSDYIGHRGTDKQYYEELQMIDDVYLKPVWSYVKTHPSTAIIIVSDHGHQDKTTDHSGKNSPVPFIISPVAKKESKGFPFIVRNRMASPFIESIMGL